MMWRLLSFSWVFICTIYWTHPWCKENSIQKWRLPLFTSFHLYGDLLNHYCQFDLSVLLFATSMTVCLYIYVSELKVVVCHSFKTNCFLRYGKLNNSVKSAIVQRCHDNFSLYSEVSILFDIFVHCQMFWEML